MKKILLIEDDPFLSSLLGNRLKKEGFELVSAKSGNEANKLLKASNPDANDLFGSSIAVHGNTIAVGAAGEASTQNTITNGSGASSDNTNTNSGAVYIYTRQ